MLSLAHVKRYQELGLVVHPCCPPTHRCQSPGKIPFNVSNGHHMKEWQKHEQFSLDQWQEWIDYDSEINIGFLCGAPSSLVCIDVDSDEGQALLEDSEIDDWKNTWQYKTGRGLRVLYRSEKGGRSFTISRGDSFVEILGDGKQSVLPPSVHPNGNQYRWLAGCSPRDRAPLSTDGWMRRIQPTVEITSEGEDWEAEVQKDTPAGARNETMTRLAGHLMHPGPMPAEEVYIWLSMYNNMHNKPPLADREVRSVISSIGRRETAQAVVKDREVKAIAKRHSVSYADAAEMWRSS